MTKSAMVESIVKTLGKDAPLKTVIDKVKETYPNEQWVEGTLSSYWSTARGKLGFSKTRSPKIENSFSLGVDDLVATKKFIGDNDIDIQQCFTILEYAQKTGIDKVKQCVELLKSIA